LANSFASLANYLIFLALSTFYCFFAAAALANDDGYFAATGLGVLSLKQSSS